MGKKRNKITYYQYIFEQLRNKCIEAEMEYELNTNLYVDTTPDEDSLVEQCELLLSYNHTSSKKCCTLQYERELYLICSGTNILPTEIPSHYFEYCSENAGLWTFAIKTLNLNPLSSIDLMELYDDVLFQEENDDFKPICVNKINVYFPNIQIFKILPDSVFFEAPIEKMYGYLLSLQNPPNQRMSEETRKEYEILYESENNNIPYEVIIHSLESVTFKHSYIELYRCIERLFPIPSLEKVKKEFGLEDLCSLHMACKLEDNIGWRPKECDAIKLLVENTESSTQECFELTRSQIPEYCSMNISNFIYKIRNQIVHFRGSLGQVQFSDSNWNGIIVSMLKVVSDLYNKYDVVLSLSESRISS